MKASASWLQHTTGWSPFPLSHQNQLALFHIWNKPPKLKSFLNFRPLLIVESLSRVRLYHPMDCSTSGFSVLLYLPEFAQTHVHGVSDDPTISSSVVPFSSCPESFPASGSFPVSQLFTNGDQNTGASASASVLPMNIQDLFPLGLTGWISLQSKGLSRVFSNTTVQKHQFFGTQPSLWSNSHICTWLLEKS